MTTFGLHNLAPIQGKTGRRVGRGTGSGSGTTAGRGQKGQRARSGGRNPRFEGGRTPLYKLLPKLRGFTSRFTPLAFVNVGDLEKNFKDGESVTRSTLAKAGLTENSRQPVKILGGGDLKKKLAITVDAVSEGAKKKIESAGGSVVVPKAPTPKKPEKKG